MTWRVLGPDTVELAAGTVRLAPRPQAVLLTLLAAPNQAVSTDRVVDTLWGERAPDTAHNSVARFVADLRRALGTHRDRVATVPGGYRIDVRPGELDVDGAEAALSEATALLGGGDPDRSHEVVVAGLGAFASWPNRVLADLVDMTAVVRRHEELRIALMELAAEAQLRRGHPGETVAELESAVEAYPLHEQFWALLMRALYRSGRQADALDAYQRLVHVLDEIGLRPAPAVRRLEAEILAHTEGEPERAPVPPDDREAVRAAQFDIADPRTSLVGREAECREVEQAIRANRLVSIVGLGGCGKTRLALAATPPRDSVEPVVYRVGLRSVRDPAQVLAAVAAVVGAPADGMDDAVSLARLFPRQPVVLLLDSCEQVRSACAALVDALLDHAPDVRILATSREPLAVEGESVYRLQPLDVPSPGDASTSTPAMALFIDRARAQVSSLPLDPETLATIGEICRALSGLPIAIELAAAQVAYLSPADVLARLDEPLPGPTSGDEAARTSLAGVLEWSWGMLTADQQALLARLSVFEDSWSLEAADAVCGGSRRVTQDLAALVDKSLVTKRSATGRTRYGMLEAVHDFAAERLADRGETDEAKDRLVEWLGALMAPWRLAELHSWADAIDALEPEHANLTVALGHLQTNGRREELGWLAFRATGMWTQRGFPHEAVGWLQPLVDDEALPDELRSAPAAGLTDAASAMGDRQAFVRWGVRSLELADGRPHDWVPHVTGVLAIIGLVLAVPFTADELFERSVRAAEASDSRATNLALASLWRGQVDFGLRRYEAALDRFRIAQAHCAQRGRILLLCEVGEGLSLFMTSHDVPGRQVEAIEAAAAWKSDARTDEWHYLVDVARAVIDGGGGRAREASTELAAAVRRLQPATVWGRSDDFQAAFGLLADYRGDHELADDLLATSLPVNALLAVVLIEHVARKRGREGEAGWVQTAIELLSRALPDDPEERYGGATGLPELVAWWAEGRAGPDPVGVG